MSGKFAKYLSLNRSSNQDTMQSKVFLDLPGEIRNQIYDNVFANIEDEKVLRLTRRGESVRKELKHVLRRIGASFLTAKNRRYPLAFQLTGKQIRSETFAYVHGVVRAESALHIPPRAPYVNGLRIAENHPRYELTRALRELREPLSFVTHLELCGVGTLRALCHQPQPGQLPHRPTWKAKAAVPEQIKLSAALLGIRKSLMNVQCITITFCRKDHVPLPDNGLPTLWLWDVMWPGQETLRVCETFPRLGEVRILSDAVGTRYFRMGDADNSWREWYVPEIVPFVVSR